MNCWKEKYIFIINCQIFWSKSKIKNTLAVLFSDFVECTCKGKN